MTAGDVAELLAAAEKGPPAWLRGLHEHLARRTGREHGRSCCTCWAYSLGYNEIDWPLDDHEQRHQ
ncbi:hypothetical protein ETD86_37315 [Nonomuraea turkmeniaca]|uniref:Uncharacterized protein n=1 Tax=Nonomuraea turkmeniaca TaxID=103838 RepID=A0A5S4F4B2_9ACTN|nr:hypothetical protein [Nonomuraea turkmeniaca]TMR10978.1 hypothetical protein ETD86_37315 [Nonomuraea turkmeniaca]